ncbi:hypothetical protein D3C84_690620 [compost metagenome]
MSVQHVVRGVHAAFCPSTEVGHEVFLIAAVQGLAVGPHIGPGNTLEGNNQNIARSTRCREQLASIQIQLGEPRHIGRNVANVILQPFFCAHLHLAHACGQQQVRQVEQVPLLRVGGLQVLRAPMGYQEQQWCCPRASRQARCRRGAPQPLC